MLATWPRSASSGYHVEFYEGCYQKHTNPLNCRTNSSDISGDHADFHEGHGTVGEWQGRGAAWHGNCKGTAWARYGMCELALSVSAAFEPGISRYRYTILLGYFSSVKLSSSHSYLRNIWRRSELSITMLNCSMCVV
jgi:hypothetical protein